MTLPEGNLLKNGIMDKGYDSDNIRQQLIDAEMVPVIPSKKNLCLDFTKEVDLGVKSRRKSS